MKQRTSLKKIERIILPILRKNTVSRAGIFGSFARGKPKIKSDIDVLVDFDDVPDLIKFIQLERKLQALLGKKVDLVRKQSIREELRGSILRELKII